MHTEIETSTTSAVPSVAPRSIFSGRIPALDGIRGLAILAVTAYRFSIGPDDNRLPGKLLFKALHHGDLGVDLFFVLSGFLITGILFDAKGEDHYFRNFYARRALRIFPLYYGFLFVTLVALPLFGNRFDLFPEAKANQAWLWLYGANILMTIRDQWCLGSFTHFWSLSVEEHFYLIWPLIIFFSSRRIAMVASLFAIAISVVGRIVWIRLGGGEVAVETFTLFYLDGLAIGSLIALAVRGPRGIKPLIRWAFVAAILSGATMLGIGLLPNERLLDLPTLVIAIFFGSLLVLAVASRTSTLWGIFWRSKVLSFFGKYSYAMYVFQLPLIRILDPVFSAEGLCLRLGSIFYGRILYILVMMAITTALAYLSWHLYEKHFLRLKVYFESTPSPMSGRSISRQSEPEFR
jgi:peptidoglycan/LPS O-acetylase OafA/YrhL